MSENTGTTNFCPHVPPGEPPCAACRGDAASDDEPDTLDAQAAEIERLRAENAALKASVNGAWSEKMVQQIGQPIGDLLGLAGEFLVDYGTEHIASAIMALKASNDELRASADEAQAARLAAVAEVAATQERLQAAESRVKALEAALEEIDDAAMQAQSEWSSVEEPYAPEWALGYKGIRDVAADALKGGAE